MNLAVVSPVRIDVYELVAAVAVAIVVERGRIRGRWQQTAAWITQVVRDQHRPNRADVETAHNRVNLIEWYRVDLARTPINDADAHYAVASIEVRLKHPHVDDVERFAGGVVMLPLRQARVIAPINGTRCRSCKIDHAGRADTTSTDPIDEFHPAGLFDFVNWDHATVTPPPNPQ